MKLCVFYRIDSEARLAHKRMDPPIPGDYLTDLPGYGAQEWYVERRRHRLEREEVEVWVTLVS